MTSEYLSRSAWDRLMDKIARPWDQRLALLEAARSELREIDRNADRVVVLDQAIRRLEDARDAARRDLVDLDRRRYVAVTKAADEVGRTAKWNRTSKMDDAREREREWQEEATAATRRTVISRMATAERDLASLHKERAPIGLDPVLRDLPLVEWLRSLRPIVDQTQERDVAARRDVLGPWERHQEISLAIGAKLSAELGDDVVTNQAFGEGAIHVVAGSRLAVIEVRDGRSNVRVDNLGTSTHLYEVRPDGDAPLGVFDGSTDRLREAVTRVAGATGGRPAPIICITAWRDSPRIEIEGGVVLCGPSNILDVIRALPETDHSPSCLAAAATQLSQIPMPSLTVRTPAGLQHLRTIDPADIPDSLPNFRELVGQAHRPLPRLAHSPARVTV